MVRETSQVNTSVSTADRPAPPRHDPRNTEEARDQIERTRSRMTETIDALEEKLSPHRLIDQATDAIKSSGAQRRVVEVVRDNPVPSALIAAGVTWLIGENLRGRRRHELAERPTAEISGGPDVSERAEAARQRAGEAAGRAGEAVRETGESTADAARQAGQSALDKTRQAGHAVSSTIAGVRDKVTGMAGGMRDRAADLSGRARERSQQMHPRQTFWESFEDHPMAIAAGFVAAGVLAGLLIPSTRREEEMIGPAADRTIDRARQRGAQVVRETTEEVTDKVSGAAHAVAEKAGERLSQDDDSLVEKVRGTAREAADETRQQMREGGLMSEHEQDENRPEGSQQARPQGHVAKPQIDTSEKSSSPASGSFQGDAPAQTVGEPGPVDNVETPGEPKLPNEVAPGPARTPKGTAQQQAAAEARGNRPPERQQEKPPTNRPSTGSERDT